jgi:phage baseplate assembly protein V
MMNDSTVQRMLAPITRRVRLMLGRAVVNMVNDTLKAQNMQVSVLEDESPDDVERLQNYGQISVPLAGAEAIVASIGADRDSMIAVIVEDRRYRPTGLPAGDTGVYHFEGHRIRLTKDGRCIITCKTLEVFADESATFDTPKGKFTGDLEVDKNLLVNGATESKGKITAPDAELNGMSVVGHKHKENGDGGGITDAMQ